MIKCDDAERGAGTAHGEQRCDADVRAAAAFVRGVMAQAHLPFEEFGGKRVGALAQFG